MRAFPTLFNKFEFEELSHPMRSYFVLYKLIKMQHSIRTKTSTCIPISFNLFA